jgi:hypothetical protein
MRCDGGSLVCQVIPPKPLEANLKPPEYKVSPVICLPGTADREEYCPDATPKQPSPKQVSPITNPLKLTLYIGSQEFKLDGKDGVFPINAPLAKALREAKSSTVKIITPRKWEAMINPEAVKNLSVIYQESGSSQMRR